jgi:alanine racemase
VDAAAFAANIAMVRQVLGPSRLCAVMKADAYGNSVALLMGPAMAAGITDIGIANNDEAMVARRHGYKGRLLRIRTATIDEMADGLRWRIQELLGNADNAAALAGLWRQTGQRRSLPVQLALNAGGMSRNGLELATPAGKAAAQRLLALPELAVTGVMTHYPSEQADDILAQLARFQADVAWARTQGLPACTRHTANSFASLLHPATRLDMARVGGLLYGDPGSVPDTRFRPTITVKSRIAALNAYPAGQTVNYDRIYRLQRDSLLANVPLGYADGIRRSFSRGNRPEFPVESATTTQVLINGRRFPVVGRVTMNTLMVDVTDACPGLVPGAEVVLFGAQGSDRITQAELEASGHGYGPELLAILGTSLPRVLAGGAG